MEPPEDPPEEYLMERIHSALVQDPRVSEPELGVKIVGGKVFVSGTVATVERRDAVAAVVREAAPRHEVHNLTTVEVLPESDEVELLP
jgi:osmotically-inducible protein OsmY